MDAPECPMCTGEAFYLGQLGLREHFRCRDCGWTFSRLAVAGVLSTPFGYTEES